MVGFRSKGGVGGGGDGAAASAPIAREVASVAFSFYSANDIRRMSVKQISNPILLDTMNRPSPGGLYDPALGPMDEKGETCATCELNAMACPGHFGHIELAAPCFNPITFRVMYKMLNSLCYYCHHLRFSRLQVHHFLAKLTLIRAGLVVQSLALDDLIAAKPSAPAKSGSKAKNAKVASAVDDEAMEDNGEEDGGAEDDGGIDRMEQDGDEDTAAVDSILEQPRTAEQLIAQIDEYVRRELSQAGFNSVAEINQLRHRLPKATMITDALQRLQRDFLASVPAIRCGNCKGVSPKFRKEGAHKIFEKSLPEKSKSAMRARGLKFQALFSASGQELLATEGVNDGGEEDVSHGGAEFARQIQEVSAAIEPENAEDDAPDADSDDDIMAITANAKTTSKTKVDSEVDSGDDKARYLSSIEIRAHLNLLWSRERRLLDALFGSPVTESVKSPLSELESPLDLFSNRRSSSDIFFLEVLAVTPVRFRPASKLGDSLFEDVQNTHLADILKTNLYVRELRQEQIRLQKEQNGEVPSTDAPARSKSLVKRPIASTTPEEILGQIVQACIRLQEQVNVYLDSSKTPNKTSIVPPPGVRQILEKKEGLFRKHMMGKRVNYAARSVISPDPYIETNEIGVPPAFASKLTYPEPVTSHNFERLRAAVINGPSKWPGATAVINEDGQVLSLEAFDESGRTAIANQLLTPSFGVGEDASRAVHTNKKVLRHIRDGDFLLMNRQPTLHKPSMMCHTARILPGEKTIRMHYANCNTYNADFDGDEMNMHFPQNDIARAEAMLIARTDQQYLVPTDGGVLRGLIQDHVDAGVHLTSRDTFLDEEEYMQLVCTALKSQATGGAKALRDGKIEQSVVIGDRGHIVTVPPAVWKPYKRWTGKQVISTILLNLAYDKPRVNLLSKCRVPAKSWGRAAPEESHVLVMSSNLLTGILDKSQLGASAQGLVHAVYELHGPSHAAALLSTLGRLLTSYLQHIGFTCRMDDLRLTEEGDRVRRKKIDESKPSGLEATLEHFGIKRPGASSKNGGVDAATAARLKAAMEAALRDNDKQAALDGSMRSKTSPLTSSIISAAVPEHLLRPFPHNNMQVMTVSGAKGSAVNVSQISCLLGQQELEGRRVPVMISGKTLPSFLAFDPSMRAGGFVAGRFLTGIKPQEYFFHCMAGREGLIDTAVKTSRSGYLQRCIIKHLEGIRVHYDQTVRDADGSVLQFLYGEDGLDVVKCQVMNNLPFCAMNHRALVARLSPMEVEQSGLVDSETAGRFIKRRAKALASGETDGKTSTDPVMSVLPPSRYLGSVSEKFLEDMDSFVSANKDGLLEVEKSKKAKGQSAQPPRPQTSWSGGKAVSGRLFKFLMNLKYMHSLAEPGEAVGLLAAHSVGEPSTQMTLNTFHFAGFGAKNVTLGIPRLREIIMTASSSIKTPLMRLPLLPHIDLEIGAKIARQLSRLTVANVLESASVKERVVKAGSLRKKVLTIRLSLWPKQDLESEHNLRPSAVFQVIEKSMTVELDRAVVKMLKPSKSIYSSETVQPESKGRKTAKKKKAEGDEAEQIGVALGSFENQRRAGAGQDGEGEGGEEEGGKDDTRGGKGGRRRAKDDEDSDDEAAAAGGDADDIDDPQLAKRRQKGLADFDEPEDESADEDEEAAAAAAAAGDEDEPEDGPSPAANWGVTTKHVVGFRRDTKADRWCEIDMEFDVATKKILMVAVVERVAKKVVIREVPGISKSYIMPKQSESETTDNLGTEGVNFRGIWKYVDYIDLNNIYSNDIAAILRTYGVEAARAAIVSEINSVFGVYGINVNRRHLSLISDYMTFEGSYKPFNRIGMTSNASPFAQMSYETTAGFLTTATLAGDTDPLDNPSARIVLGKVVRGGTGAFDVLQPLPRPAAAPVDPAAKDWKPAGVKARTVAVPGPAVVVPPPSATRARRAAPGRRDAPVRWLVRDRVVAAS